LRQIKSVRRSLGDVALQAADLLRYLVSVLEDLDLPYALVGSIASMAYGEPRATLAIDVVVPLDSTDIERPKTRFPSDEFYLDVEAAGGAVAEGSQFNILHPSSGLKIDVFVEGDEVERVQIEDRRRLPALPGLTAAFSPPEELILKKLLYYRDGGSEKHLRDVKAMLEISGDAIDVDRVERGVEGMDLREIWPLVYRPRDSGEV
jgi:hypothetical protein